MQDFQLEGRNLKRDSTRTLSARPHRVSDSSQIKTVMIKVPITTNLNKETN